jgi:hypothetical protein
MIAELVNRYHAVLCRRCRERIPVSSKRVRQDDEKVDASAARARCRLCDYESVYAVGDVQEFEGNPRIRELELKSVPSRRSPCNPLAGWISLTHPCQATSRSFTTYVSLKR